MSVMLEGDHTKDEHLGTCSTHGRDVTCMQNIGQKGRCHLQDQSVDGKK
jgi:hypothetical protein